MDAVRGGVVRYQRQMLYAGLGEASAGVVGCGALGSMNGPGSHHTWGILDYWLSARMRFFNSIGWTLAVHNPDSWEGCRWGAMHHWERGRLAVGRPTAR